MSEERHKRFGGSCYLSTFLTPLTVTAKRDEEVLCILMVAISSALGILRFRVKSALPETISSQHQQSPAGITIEISATASFKASISNMISTRHLPLLRIELK